MSNSATAPQGRPSRFKRWLRRAAWTASVTLMVGAVVSVALSYYVRGPSDFIAGSGNLLASEPAYRTTPAAAPVELTVMTLNAAHGRANGFHQAFQSTKRVTENLDHIVEAVRAREPDIVTLQEADGPSIWSGEFDHVAYVAEGSGLAHAFRGEHVSGLKLSYGTALLSRYPLDQCASITFAATPPTFPKGFVVSEAIVPGVGPVTVASVHLDFARQSVRQEQVERLVEELKQRPRPMIVMGDFNCAWDDEPSLPTLAEKLDLKVFEPASTASTFPSTGKRLDWIFVSGQIEFLDYQVGKQGLSDHQPVIAKLRIHQPKVR